MDNESSRLRLRLTACELWSERIWVPRLFLADQDVGRDTGGRDRHQRESPLDNPFAAGKGVRGEKVKRAGLGDFVEGEPL